MKSSNDKCRQQHKVGKAVEIHNDTDCIRIHCENHVTSIMDNICKLKENILGFIST